MANVKQMISNYSEKIQSPRGVRSPVFQKQFLPTFGSQSPHNSQMRSTVSTPNLQQGRTVIAKTIGSVKSLVHNFDKSDASDANQVLVDESFALDFFTRLSELRKNQTFTNIRLQGSDTTDDTAGIDCDGIVLAACSPLIKDRYQDHVTSKKDNPLTIHLDNITSDLLDAVVGYVYSGEVDFDSVDCRMLLKTSVHLKITTLQMFCARAGNEKLSGQQKDDTYADAFFTELSKLYQTFPSDLTVKCLVSPTPPGVLASVPPTIPAHRAILAAGSLVIHDLLCDGEKIPDMLALTDYKERTLKAAFKLFYSGGLPVPPTLAGYLLQFCKYLKLDDLSAQLEAFMEQHLDTETAVFYYKTAKELGLAEMENNALETILGQFNKVFLFEGFLTLTQDDLIVILSDDRLSTGDQHDDLVFDAVIKWLEGNNVNEFSAEICQLFDCVRFDFVSHSYLKDKILCHRFMKYFPQRTYATNAIKYQISNIRSTACLPKPPRTGLTFSALVVVSESNELLVYKTKDAQKRWQRILKLPLWCDAESVYSVVEGGIIVSGGLYKKSCLFYDSKNKDNIQFPNMNVAKGKHGAAYHKGLLFVVGGTKEGFECLDMGDRVWVPLAPIPGVSTLHHPIVVANETHVYVIGGISPQGVQSSLYVYDIKQGMWIQHADVPQPCDATCAGASIVGGKVCVIINRTETIMPTPTSPKLVNGDTSMDNTSTDEEVTEIPEVDLPPKSPIRVGKVVDQLNEQQREKQNEEPKAKIPMCEGRLIGHLDDKKNVEKVTLRVSFLDMITNKWEAIDECDTQLTDDEARVIYQPITFNGEATILVGCNLMTFNVEEKQWKSVHTIPKLPNSVIGGAGGKVARLLCAQFPA